MPPLRPGIVRRSIAATLELRLRVERLERGVPGPSLYGGRTAFERGQNARGVPAVVQRRDLRIQHDYVPTRSVAAAGLASRTRRSPGSAHRTTRDAAANT
ncbi:hypothetical protein GCM10009533_69020 [Saccharopolyspora spinosporotrichia]|uniref:Uncharacterized protein n=1 Tax=Saccharopolyspora erythraea TaxID=1836 RepID=A0ABP3P913_SACER